MAGSRSANSHTLDSVVPELEGAAGLLRAEIDALAREEEELRASVSRAVGGLSDLRYGKLGSSKLRGEVVDGLEALEEACGRKLG